MHTHYIFLSLRPWATLRHPISLSLPRSRSIPLTFPLSCPRCAPLHHRIPLPALPALSFAYVYTFPGRPLPYQLYFTLSRSLDFCYFVPLYHPHLSPCLVAFLCDRFRSIGSPPDSPRPFPPPSSPLFFTATVSDPIIDPPPQRHSCI